MLFINPNKPTMKLKRLFYPTLLLVLTLCSTVAHAQFEGHISINLYGQENGKTEVSEVNLFATENRIMIKGEQGLDFMNKVNSDGLLIRNDKKDFVVMTGENQALQVTKAEIESMVQMLSGWGDSASDSENTPDTDYRFSERTQQILGYDTAELIITTKDEPNKHLSVWLTPDIDINWGMLAEKWNNMPSSMDKELNGMGQEIFFKGKNFPLLVESVEGNKRETVMEVKKVDASSVEKATVEVPAGVKLLSFKDFVFNMMMDQ
jgi:hypothetical protein